MAEAFAAAAVRHYEDGELLERSNRVSNADQLFGFSAECAIKTALVTLPGASPGRALADKYREHIDRLWDLASLQSLHRRFPALSAVLQGQRPFADWSTDARYDHDNAVSLDALQRHHRAAARVLGAVGLTKVRR